MKQEAAKAQVRLRVFAGERLSEYGLESLHGLEAPTVGQLRAFIQSTSCGGPYARYSFIDQRLESAPQKSFLLALLAPKTGSTIGSITIDIEAFSSSSSSSSSSKEAVETTTPPKNKEQLLMAAMAQGARRYSSPDTNEKRELLRRTSDLARHPARRGHGSKHRQHQGQESRQSQLKRADLG